MQIFIIELIGQRDRKDVNELLCSKGWDILCTCTKLNELTVDVLTTKYDFDIQTSDTILKSMRSITRYDKIHTLDVELTCTSFECKKLLSAKIGLLPSYMRFVYQGKAMHNNKTLTHCKIQDGSTIHLVHGVRGD